MRLGLHGLVIDSELAFAAHSVQPKATADVVIEIADGNLLEAEETVAELGSAYRVSRDVESYYLRFRDVCTFRIARDAGRIEVAMVPGADTEFTSLLLGGSALSLNLMLRDFTVLHASAVELEAGPTFAFVGASGMGKSTLAALLCSAGGALVTDDVLRVTCNDGVALWYAGSPELRLRATAEALAELIPARERRRTCDDRVAVRVESCAREQGVLEAIVFPRFSAVAEGITTRRLTGAEAALALLKQPRLPGWRSSNWYGWHLRHAAALARTVPVFETLLPRSSELSVELGKAIGDALLRELKRP